MSDIELLQRRVERERLARREAESLLEQKSRELYLANQELKQLADNMARSEARIRSIVRAAAEAIVVTDEEGVILSVNTATLDIFNYDSESALEGENVSLLMPVYQQGVDITLKDLVESQGRQRGGEGFPVERSVNRVAHGDGCDMIWIIRDISERKQTEQELKDLHQRLLDTSREAGMAEIAASVLHNVGNVLNSVTTAADIINAKLEGSKVTGLAKATQLIQTHRDDLVQYLTDDQGQKLIQYLELLADQLVSEKQQLLEECGTLRGGIEHIKEVIRSQQNYTGCSGLLQPMSVDALLRDAVAMSASTVDTHGIEVINTIANVPDKVTADKHRVMQIVGNLVRNAVQSLAAAKVGSPQMWLEADMNADSVLTIRVADNGLGISSENLERIFSYGFTTKRDGHGLGLHGSVLAAKALGGELTAVSDGVGKGAAFALKIPVEVVDAECVVGNA